MSSVYFIKPIGQLGPVKIGFTDHLAKRARCVAVQSPLLLEVVCSAPGGQAEERLLHERFAGQHMHGEWFAWSKDLQFVMDRVAETGALPELVAVFPRPTLHRRSPSNGHASRVKANLTRRVRIAERRIYPWPRKIERPAEIVGLITAYQGAHNPPPSPTQIDELEHYIADLEAKAAA